MKVELNCKKKKCEILRRKIEEGMVWGKEKEKDEIEIDDVRRWKRYRRRWLGLKKNDEK